MRFRCPSRSFDSPGGRWPSDWAIWGLLPALRAGEDGSPYVTDEGNYILDCAFGRIEDPAALAARLDAMPGVVGHGLFIGLANTVIVGRGEGTLVIDRPGR